MLIETVTRVMAALDRDTSVVVNRITARGSFHLSEDNQLNLTAWLTFTDTITDLSGRSLVQSSVTARVLAQDLRALHEIPGSLTYQVHAEGTREINGVVSKFAPELAFLYIGEDGNIRLILHDLSHPRSAASPLGVSYYIDMKCIAVPARQQQTSDLRSRPTVSKAGSARSLMPAEGLKSFDDDSQEEMFLALE